MMPELSSFAVELELRINATPTRVFDLLTIEIDSWWPFRSGDGPATMSLDPRIGGAFVQSVEGGGEQLWAMVTRIQPGVYLTLTGPLDMNVPMVGVIDFRLVPDGTGTLLQFSHRAFGMFPDSTGQKYEGGWPQILRDHLKPAAESKSA